MFRVHECLGLCREFPCQSECSPGDRGKERGSSACLLLSSVNFGASAKANAFHNQTRSVGNSIGLVTAVRGARNQNWSGTLEFRHRRIEFRDCGISWPGVDTFFVLFTFEDRYDIMQF